MKKRSTRQARCKAIIQSPEYNIGARDAQKHLAETIQKIKDIYFEIYGESLQKPNKKVVLPHVTKQLLIGFMSFPKIIYPKSARRETSYCNPDSVRIYSL